MSQMSVALAPPIPPGRPRGLIGASIEGKGTTSQTVSLSTEEDVQRQTDLVAPPRKRVAPEHVRGGSSTPLQASLHPIGVTSGVTAAFISIKGRKTCMQTQVLVLYP